MPIPDYYKPKKNWAPTYNEFVTDIKRGDTVEILDVHPRSLWYSQRARIIGSKEIIYRISSHEDGDNWLNCGFEPKHEWTSIHGAKLRKIK